MATENSPAETATKAPRHGFVDALRGFALLGILLVNIEFIVQPAEIGWAEYTSDWDRVWRWLVVALGQTKVYPLFAMLFGYGLSIQVRNARRRGTDLAPRYRRRMIGIGVLGVLHGILFFPGDILLIYAVIGALAFRLRHAEADRLLRIAGTVYAVAGAIWLAVGGLDLIAATARPTADADAVDVLANGSFVEVVVLHFFYWVVTQGILVLVQGAAVFASFLVGMVAGRTDMLQHPLRNHRPLVGRALRLAPVGLLGGAVGATMTVTGGRWDTLGFAVGFAAAPFLAAAYLAGLAIVVERAPAVVSDLLEAAGRMSLSIYLLESIVVSTLAYGYGFGLFGSTGPAAGLAIALGVWVALAAFAWVWIRRLRFGPFEWALRSFTYGEVQSMSKVDLRPRRG